MPYAPHNILMPVSEWHSLAGVTELERAPRSEGLDHFVALMYGWTAFLGDPVPLAIAMAYASVVYRPRDVCR